MFKLKEVPERVSGMESRFCPETLKQKILMLTNKQGRINFFMNRSIGRMKPDALLN